ncbi:MAG: hypothetical protein K2Q13_08265 [Nitrosomonas sp.]|uniref:hypothetical protein n=1 Tax=Nitrosomonas sp. TaxID=42353 RepID=UPI0025FB4A85|nr:hypothetical protein [Nitrosomonas sp.]MBY0475039.1 hypothetical protein [Nitrosomonas sp.]
MSKFLIAAIGLAFLLGSSVTMASGNKESSMPPMSAQDILNKMQCDNKKAGEKIKDRVDGEMVTCPAKLKQPNFGK